jgi:glycerol-3-phosphate dehydrogenase
LLGDARTPEDLGRDLGAGLHEAEVRFLHATEWARTAEDVLWRRTKLGLQVDEAAAGRIERLLSAIGKAAQGLGPGSG